MDRDEDEKMRAEAEQQEADVSPGPLERDLPVTGFLASAGEHVRGPKTMHWFALAFQSEEARPPEKQDPS